MHFRMHQVMLVAIHIARLFSFGPEGASGWRRGSIFAALFLVIPPIVWADLNTGLAEEENVSVLAAYGSDSNEFPEAVKAFLERVPSGWSKRWIHVDPDLQGVEEFYYDHNSCEGKDLDLDNGIDTGTLFFYAGHGRPDDWDTITAIAAQSRMLIGDSDSAGLRYYWQCACQVFAHGPGALVGGLAKRWDYPSPDKSKPSSYDDSVVRRVDLRWGEALGTSLRLACGASTFVRCDEDVAKNIWRNYSDKLYDVADSFVLALSSTSAYVPLCMAYGGASPRDSGLYDPRITTLPNKFGGDYLYVQYTNPFVSGSKEDENLSWLNTVLGQHAGNQRYGFLTANVFDHETFLEESPLVEGNVEGDVVVSSCNTSSVSIFKDLEGYKVEVYICMSAVDDPSLLPFQSEEFYVEAAKAFVVGRGWASKSELSSFQGMRLLIDAYKVSGDSREQYQKSVVIRFKRILQAPFPPFPPYWGLREIGAGGTIAVQLNNSGDVIRASRDWKEPQFPPPAVVKWLTRLEAEKKARSLLGDSVEQFYQVDRVELGYAEVDDLLEPVFVFDFFPVGVKQGQFPPRRVQVQATSKKE